MIRAVKIWKYWERWDVPVLCPISIWVEPKTKILSLVSPKEVQTIGDTNIMAILYVDEPGETSRQTERQIYVVSEDAELPKDNSHGWAFLATLPVRAHQYPHLHFYIRII